MKSINLAVIGAGYWGKKVIQEYIQLATKNPEINLSRVCDLTYKNLRICKEILNVPEYKLASNHSDALNSNDINAVHICTPNETHYEIGKEALEAGKHVLLEKPMTINSIEAKELKHIAESKNLILQVGHIYRFNNALKKMQDLLADKFLGEIYYLKLQWTTYLPYPANTDIVFDLAPHPVDILNFLVNDWPNKVFCRGKPCRRKTLEEFAHIMMEYKNNLLAFIELSWLHPGKARVVTISGSNRSALVDCFGQSIRIFENSTSQSFDIVIKPNNTILDEISAFVKSINDNNISKKINENGNDASQGVNNVVVLENLRKSMKEDKMVDVVLDKSMGEKDARVLTR